MAAALMQPATPDHLRFRSSAVRSAVVSVRSHWLRIILLASFALNVTGLEWGLPQRWHPDELTQRAENMVGGPTLNPHYFAYGGFHYYVLAAVAVLPVKIPNKIFGLVDYAAQSSAVVALSRLVSAAMGTGIVYLSYRIGAALFCREAGLLAAAFNACSMVLVNAAHFATADIPSLFWFMLTSTAAAAVLRNGSTTAYLIAGIAAGLSGAVKYVGALALVVLVLGHVLSARPQHRVVIAAIALAAVAFVLGNPTFFVAPIELVDGLVAENLFNSLRGIGLSRAYLPLITQLREAVGVPLFLLGWIGILYALYLLSAGHKRAEVLLVFGMLLPYYLVVGSMRGPRAGPLLLPIAPVRYTLPLVPFVLILAAVACVDLYSSRALWLRRIAASSVAVTLLYSAAYAGAADWQFVRDSRYAARDWVLIHVLPGATVETTSYGPDIPTDRYAVLERPHDNGVAGVAQALSASPAYLRYRGATAPIRSWLQSFGVDAEDRYRPWSERAADEYARAVSTFDVTIRGLEARAPDILIVSDLYTTRFQDSTTHEGAFFDALRSGATAYREVASFHRKLPRWLSPAPEFVNPRITIYAHPAQ